MSSVLTKINDIFRNLCPRRVMSPQEVYKLEDDHERRIPVFEHGKLLGDFTNESFPDGDEYQGLTEAVRGMTDIIVLINLSAISPNRNANRSFEMKEDSMRTGTGIVSGVTKYISGNRKCYCSKCRDSDDPSKVWGKIHITTGIGLVVDDIEGKHATFRFVYKKNVNTIPFTGCIKVKPDPENGTCELTFATCDTDLLDELEVTLKMLQGLSNKRKVLVNLRGLSNVFANVADLTQRIPVCDNAPKWLSLKLNGPICTELAPKRSSEDTALKQENVSMNLHLRVARTGFGWKGGQRVCRLDVHQWHRRYKKAERVFLMTIRLLQYGTTETTKKKHFKVGSDGLSTSDTTGSLKITNEKDSSSNASRTSESKEVKTIKINHTYLLEQLLDNNLVSILFQEQILDFLEKSVIDDQRTRKDKVDLMLDKVMSKCPESYHIFLRALEKDHKHAAEKLIQTYNLL